MVQVKGNQPTLFKEVQRILVEEKPLDYFEEHENNHGRRSSWYVFVYDGVQSCKAKEWTNLRRFIHVHKCTHKNGKIHHSDRLYISDLFCTDARYFHEGIRGHWTIENSLHWVKDVIHNEDNNRIRTKNGPMNSAVFSSIAINIHRKYGSHSITESQIKFNAKFNEIFNYFRT